MPPSDRLTDLPPVMRCPTCGAQQRRSSGYCEECGQSMDQLPPGTVIGGKWVIDRLLGTGGMGRVYLAHHQTITRPCAVKVLHRRYLNNRNLIKRFKAEAMAAGRLSHPNVVATMDYGLDSSGLLYITMEYLRGVSLETLAHETRPFPEERLINIAIQICRALEEAHARGIIHRDLKPDNVMVDEESHPPDAVKVLDFGLAKALDPAILDGMSKITVAGSTCGTPEYMSPEQAQGLELDARSDVYALGVLLYRCLVGRPPFVGPNPIAVASAHVANRVPPMSQLQPDIAVSPGLEALVLRCLVKAQSGRFSSAEDLRHALAAQRSEGQGLGRSAGTAAGPAAPAGAAPDDRTGPMASVRQPPLGASLSPETPVTTPALDAGRHRREPPGGTGHGPGADRTTGPHGRPPTSRLPQRRAPTSAGGGRAVKVAGLVLVVLGLLGAGAWLLLRSHRHALALEVTPTAGVPRWRCGSDPWGPMANRPHLLLWGCRVDTPPDAGAELRWPSGARARMAGASALSAGFLSRPGLDRGALELAQGAGKETVEVDLPAADASVMLKGRGPFSVQAKAGGTVSVANHQGLATIQIPSGQVPVNPGTRVLYQQGQPPTYTPLGPVGKP